MEKRQRPGRVIAIMVVGMLLACLAWSLWRYDYKPRLKVTPPPAKIRSALRVIASADGREQTAEFSLKNEGEARICLLDTAALEPLYQVQVDVRTADGFKPASPIGMPTPTVVGEKPLDNERDAIVELVPGSALVRCIRLSSRFDLRKEGQYRVSVAYQAQTLALTLGEAFDAWGVERCGFVSVAEFEVAPPKSKPPAPVLPGPPVLKTLPEEMP